MEKEMQKCNVSLNTSRSMQCCLELTSSPAVSHSKSNTRTPRRNTRWTGAARSARETVCSLPSRRPCYRPAVSVWTRTPLRSPYPEPLRPDPLYRRSVARKWWRDSRVSVLMMRLSFLWWCHIYSVKATCFNTKLPLLLAYVYLCFIYRSVMWR